MHPIRRERLLIACLIIVVSSAAIGLIVYALRENLNLFYPPADVLAGKAPIGKSIRVGGMVVEGSVQRQQDGLTVRFDVTDYAAVVPIVFTGILPDLFAEGEGVVTTGALDEHGVMQATEVLAKHDENYMPPEVADTLQEQYLPSKNYAP